MAIWGRVRVTAQERIKANAKGLTVTQLRELQRQRWNVLRVRLADSGGETF